MEKKKKNRFQNLSLNALLHNNKFAIIFSFLIAFILWFTVAVTVGSEMETVIRNVPVNMDLTGTVPEQFNLQAFGETEIKVDVKVKGKKYVLGRLTPDDIIVTPDTYAIDSPGKKILPLSAKPAASNVDFEVEVQRKFIEVYFDNYMEGSFSLQSQIIGEGIIPDGYVREAEILSSEEVKISGPKTIIEQVSRIISRVTVDEPLTKTETFATELVLLDEMEEEIEEEMVTFYVDNVQMTIPVLKKKSLPVTTSFVNVPPGFNLSSIQVTYSPNKLLIAGAEETIDELEQLNLGTIDLSKVNLGKNKFKFDVALSSGMKVLDETEVVTATIQMNGKSSKTFSISSENIHINNIPKGYRVTLVSAKISNVVVIGPSYVVGNISDRQIYAQADLEGKNLSEGEQSIPVSVYAKNYNNCWAYGEYNILVKVEKK